jgi:dTDP-4-dehydrorhamnose 3,5-epimerase
LKFTETPLKGAYVIEIEPAADERGFFGRTWCREEFRSGNRDDGITQCNISDSIKKSTVRGMHYQRKPYEEAKLVQCFSGAIYDVIVDIRHESPCYRKWFAVELTAANRRMLYVPRGFAHGFQTLMDDTELFYQMFESYHPECAKGIRWNDPVLDLRWPIQNPIVSQKDSSYPDFVP